MNIHMNRPNAAADENGEVVGEIDIDKMKRYITYCKSYVPICALRPSHRTNVNLRKCAPRLSPDAQEMLSSHFVGLRKQVQQVEQDNDERSSIPITIRFGHFFSYRHRLLTLPWQSTGGHYSHFRVACQNDAITCSANVPRRRSDSAIQVLYDGCCLCGLSGWPFPRRA